MYRGIFVCSTHVDEKMLILGFILSLWPLIFVLLYIVINHIAKPRQSVSIVVLGDLGRSPRMQYHAKSFAKEGYEVDLVGYSGRVGPAFMVRANSLVCLVDNIHYLNYVRDVQIKVWSNKFRIGHFVH